MELLENKDAYNLVDLLKSNLDNNFIIPNYTNQRARALKRYKKQPQDNIFRLKKLIPYCEEKKNINYQIFDRFSKIELEIGFGSGERIISEAIANPSQAYICCDIYFLSIFAISDRIHRLDLKNVFILPGDATHWVKMMANSFLDKIFILFPDPWAKAKQKKRRLITPEFVKEISRVVKQIQFMPGIQGKLDNSEINMIKKNDTDEKWHLEQAPIIIASDDPSYQDQIYSSIQSCQAIRKSCQSLTQVVLEKEIEIYSEKLCEKLGLLTRYAKKAFENNRKIKLYSLKTISHDE